MLPYAWPRLVGPSLKHQTRPSFLRGALLLGENGGLHRVKMFTVVGAQEELGDLFGDGRQDAQP